jgi:flagellar assembly protein FliH
MNSSEVRRIELPDLREPVAAPVPRPFVEQQTFERLDTRLAREPSAREEYARGLAEGEAIGRSASQKELEPVLAELQALARALGSARAERIAQVEAELIALAREIAAELLRVQVADDDDAAVRASRACLEAARGADGDMRLRVCPQDLERVRTTAPELQLDLVEGRIEIVADASLERGDVVLETDDRCYDARAQRLLDAALNRVDEETS